MLEILAVITTALMLLFLFRKQGYVLFFIILLTTEFFYIDVFGGVAHPYHFIAVVIVFLLANHIGLLFRSKVFWALMIFIFINLCAIVYSDSPERAAASSLSLGANIAVAMATALILLSGQINLEGIKRIILMVTVVSICWGLIQMLVYQTTGHALAISPLQESQIQAGFAPSFRTESNTFGKFMVVPFLLFLPDLIEYRSIKRITLIYAIFVVGILMNFTRSSIYGLMITSLFLLAWYLQKNRILLFFRKHLKLALIVAALLAVFISGIFSISDYALYKIHNLFEQQEILEGGSSAYRLNAMKLVIDEALSNTRKMIIGNGWGQTRFFIYGVEVQAGGADLVNILGYCGLLGGAAYLGYTLLAFNAVRKAALSTKSDKAKAIFAEGVLFAFVGIFFTAQMAGYLITPEYWMLLGLSMFFGVKERRNMASRRPLR